MVWSEVCFVENSLVRGLLRGKWSGLRSTSWKMVWTGGLLRGKRPGLEVCCKENGLVWISAARKMVCSTGLLD